MNIITSHITNRFPAQTPDATALTTNIIHRPSWS
jgi:hypothetical protein